VLRDRVAAFLKWPIYAGLLAVAAASTIGLWLLFVWIVLRTVQVLQ
jgi:hypothetical protein